MIYFEPNYYPDVYYPLAIMLALVTGPVGLYCPSEKIMRSTFKHDDSSRLLDAFKRLIEYRLVIPIGPEEILAQGLPSFKNRLDDFALIDPSFHNEKAKEVVSTITDKQLRRVKVPSEIPIAHCLRAANKLPTSRIKRLDEDTQVKAGLVYLLITDLALCSKSIVISKEDEKKSFFNAFQLTWMQGIMLAFNKSYSGIRPEHFDESIESDLQKYDFSTADIMLSIFADFQLQNLKKDFLWRTVYSASKKSIKEIEYIRKNFSKWEKNMAKRKKYCGEQILDFCRREAIHLEDDFVKYRENKRIGSKIRDILAMGIAIGNFFTGNIDIEKSVGNFQSVTSFLDLINPRKKDTLWISRLVI